MSMKMEAALEAIRKGKPIIVMDHPERENEGDLVMAAESATAEWVNFMARQGRGLICAAAAPEVLDRLDIPKMVEGSAGGAAHESPFTVSVEASKGISTGISAADRSRTLNVLADPCSRPADVNVPGHIFPLRAQPGGLRQRRGHTEASVALMKMAGLQPVAAICEIMNPEGTMARRPDLEAFAEEHDLVLISIEDIVSFAGIAAPAETRRQKTARSTPSRIRRAAESVLPTDYGQFKVVAFHDDRGREHVALIKGTLDTTQPTLVRVHSECMTGEVFGSRRCDCADQLQEAMAAVARRGQGVIVYMRQEGRGIGLANKIRAYALQDKGYDTVDANRALGFPDDARSYRSAAAILSELGVANIELMTNNPTKITGLKEAGIQKVVRIPMGLSWRDENRDYLTTKLTRMDHIEEPA